MRKRMIAFVLCVIGLMLGCSPKEETNPSVKLNVLAAASMTDVLEEVADLYKKENPGVDLIFHFDSSGTLKTQIEQGAPADLFISAAMKQMDELSADGFMDSDNIVKLLENKVVLIKPADSNLEIRTFEDVADVNVSMAAIANSDVPAGQYAEEIYTNLGLWNEVCAKANFASNVRQVLDWVASGNADCGIVYATDAMMEEQVIVVDEAQEGMCEKVVYPAGVVKASSHAEEAKAFIEYLQTKEVKEIFETYGFTNYKE